MATRRGLCPFCKNNNIQHSIFLVNPEAASVYCGTNMHQLDPQVAIKNYERYIDNMIKKADDTLYVVCNPSLAYQEYADVIEIDDSYVKPYLGRIICLVYMSRVRRSHISEARLLLNVSSQTKFNNPDDAEIIFAYLRRTVRVLEEYLSAVKKRLTFRQYYYDTDCLSLYLLHVEEARAFENSVFEAMIKVKKNYDSEKISTFLNFLDEKIAEKERLLKDVTYTTVSGRTYKVDKIKGDSVTVVEATKKIIDTKTARFRMASLDDNNKTTRKIKDEVFKDYTKTIKAKKVALAFFIVTLIFALGAGVVAYLFRDSFVYFIAFSSGAALFLVLSIICLVLTISWSNQISKKRRKLEIY